MISKKEVKSFKRPVEIIKLISGLGWGLLTSSPLSGVKARMRKVDKQFFLNWTTPGQSGELEPRKAGYQNLSFDFKGYSLVLEEVFDGSDMIFRHRGVKTTENVNFFYTAGFKKNASFYYRLIIPLERKMDFLFQIARKPFLDDFGSIHALGTQAVINGDELQISIFYDEKKKFYLAIESYEKQSYEIFNDKAHAVINALGFLTGHLAGNTGWYFAYKSRNLSDPVHFYHNPLRNAINTSYTPINTNPHAWIRDRKEADRLYDLKFLKPVSLAAFSNLCQKLYDSVDFSSAVLLILEASAASLIFRPGGYAIVLETMADLIIGQEKAKAPMTPALSKKVRQMLSEVIHSECDLIPDESREILLGKINQINQITNKSRLRVPFDELGLKLNSKDLELIATRNDFLHGRIPDITKAGESRPNERKNKDLYYASVRFYTLLSRLILAWVGHDNYVLNHAKIQEKFTRILLEEDYYSETFSTE
ncbi:hypothetical protein [Pedobacter sp. V48]|uniref:hypothetical protein n=1 Tax=Pedobacter sp. V48 TaxID=509635 RepID=UPI0003E4ADA2|nr:hypothetical protein [Pedobacter sp. V48]ETZ19145.1 hypothetical protein N824_10405 [Pedobacter sp. V48]